MTDPDLTMNRKDTRTKFTKGQKVLWHGAGPYEYLFERDGRSYVTAPDGWTLIAESIDLTPAPPETKCERSMAYRK